jgi:phosphoribosylformylglycinamidine synthase
VTYLVHVEITLKPTVNDPQGLTIRGGLHLLGFKSVQEVRAGKYLELTLDASSQAEAESQVREMCDKLLANPVIEQYRFTVEQAKVESTPG